MIGNFEQLKAQIDLKPCPFCGGEAKVEELESQVDLFRAVIKCQCCGANLNWSQEFYYRTKKLPSGTILKTKRIPASLSPFDAWNRRKETIDRAKIHFLERELDKYQVINKLHEADNADLRKQLEKKVEEVYPEFMRDYKYMVEELDGAYEELAELKTERDALGDALLSEKAKKCDAVERLTPQKPIEEADSFGDRSLCCPRCLGPVTNYWAPGTKPKHCQFCGQALDWGEEVKR